ncbi:MAG: diacylglycerol/lipid kinase family protein [Planctomycetota bacterium]
MDHALVVCNPRALRGASASSKVRELSRLLAPGGGVRFADLASLDAVGEPPERVVAVGGDGTANAVLSWLAERGWDRPFGLVPAGTGNNLAAGVGLPASTKEALELALAGRRTRALDVFAYRAGCENKVRYIVQTSCLGFPAAMAGWYAALRGRAVLRTLARPLGSVVYRIIGLCGLVREKVRDLRAAHVLRAAIELPGERLEEAVSAVFLGNERSLGGEFFPCPRASVDDGLADLCLVRAKSGIPYLRLFRRISRGDHLSLDRAVVYRQTPGPIRIELSSPSPFLVDGDLWTRSDRYAIEVQPSKFRIVCG